MDYIYKELKLDKEDIDLLYDIIKNYPISKIESVYSLLKKYNCSIDLIKELFFNEKYHIFDYEIDRLKYFFDAIISNNDIIEEMIHLLVKEG